MLGRWKLYCNEKNHPEGWFLFCEARGLPYGVPKSFRFANTTVKAEKSLGA